MKLFSTIFLILLFLRGYSQKEINVKECFGFYAKYYNSLLDDKLIMRYIESEFAFEYESSKSNEFQLNKLKQKASLELQNQINTVSYETIYFIDLYANVPEYNFKNQGFQLRMFPDDLRYHCNYPGHTTSGISFLSPCLDFYNANKIGTFFKMPENIAENSINKRNQSEKNKRGTFRVRVYYSFIPPSTGKNLTMTDMLGTRGLNKDHVHCLVLKVEIFDSYTNYKNTVDIENGYLNTNKEKLNTETTNTSNNELNKNTNNERTINKKSIPNILTDYENEMLNFMRSNKQTDNKCKQIISSGDFIGKYNNAICKKAFIQISNDNTSSSRMSIKRKPCIGVFGATAYTYKLQGNYLLTQASTTDNATGITKYNTTILYLDSNSDLIVYDYLTQPQKNPDLTIYRFEKEK